MAEFNEGDKVRIVDPLPRRPMYPPHMRDFGGREGVVKKSPFDGRNEVTVLLEGDRLSWSFTIEDVILLEAREFQVGDKVTPRAGWVAADDGYYLREMGNLVGKVLTIVRANRNSVDIVSPLGIHWTFKKEDLVLHEAAPHAVAPVPPKKKRAPPKPKPKPVEPPPPPPPPVVPTIQVKDAGLQRVYERIAECRNDTKRRGISYWGDADDKGEGHDQKAFVCHSGALGHLDEKYFWTMFNGQDPSIRMGKEYKVEHGSTKGPYVGGANSLRFLKFILNPEGPWRQLLPFMVTTDPETINNSGFIFTNLGRMDKNFFYSFLILSRWCYEYPGGLDVWLKAQDEHGIPADTAFLMGCNYYETSYGILSRRMADGHNPINSGPKSFKRILNADPAPKNDYDKAWGFWYQTKPVNEFDEAKYKSLKTYEDIASFIETFRGK